MRIFRFHKNWRKRYEIMTDEILGNKPEQLIEVPKCDCCEGECKNESVAHESHFIQRPLDGGEVLISRLCSMREFYL